MDSDGIYNREDSLKSYGCYDEFYNWFLNIVLPSSKKT